MSSRRTIGTTAAIAVALAGNAVITAGPALAAEGSSTLQAGCSIAADKTYMSASGLDSLFYDGTHNDGAAVPLQQTLEARSATSGHDDCGVTIEHGTSLLVGPGSTGLAAGTPVQLVATIRLVSSQITSTTSTTASYTYALADVAGRYDIVDPDSQVCGGEVCSFRRFLSFDTRSTRVEYEGGNATAEYSYRYGSDLVPRSESYGDTNLPTIDVQVPFTALVGSALRLQGRLSELATSSADASAVADVATGDNGFDVDIAAGADYAGISLELGASENSGPQDTTPPVLTLPDDITTTATSADGAVVQYVVTAVDETDTDPAVTCGPMSGSSFPIGTTAVNCTAVDDSGNVAGGTFNVTVSPPAVATPAQQIADLIDMLDGYELEPGQARALRAKLESALNALTTGETNVAINALEAFVQHAEAQSGNKLTVEQSSALVTAARAIQKALST